MLFIKFLSSNYLTWSWLVVTLISILLNFVLYSQCFLTNLLTLGILFSAALRSVVVAKLVILDVLTSFISAIRAVVVLKLVILDICFLISFILALRVVLGAKLLIIGILSSIFFILA